MLLLVLSALLSEKILRTTLSLTLETILLKPAVVNMATIGIKHPEHVYDLPVGAPRWAQDVYGCKCSTICLRSHRRSFLTQTVADDMTMVAGVPTFIEGVHTGSLPGKLVRNPLTGAQRDDWPDVPSWAARGTPDTSYQLGLTDDSAQASAAEALKNSMNEEQGMTHMSRISRAMDAERKKKQQQSKL